MTKNIFSILMLLMTAATGAWADDVACIGTTNYATIKAAGEAANSGETIKLLADVSNGDNLIIQNGKAVELDLNGHIIRYPYHAAVEAIGAGSRIVITDSSTGTPGGIIGFTMGYDGGKIVVKNGRFDLNNFDAETILESLADFGWVIPFGYTLENVFNAPDAQGFLVCVEPPTRGVPVEDFAWNNATKQGTYSMPAGKVNVKVKYYKQATAADDAVTAGHYILAETDTPLVTINESKLKGASAMMYLVTTTNAAPDYSDSF